MSRVGAHPYMANSAPGMKEQMLEAVGAATVEDLLVQIPESHRFRGKLGLPAPLSSEVELARHLRELLGKNDDCERNLSFLGAGCWQHYVPAVCDEIVRRSEFVTPVWGTPSSDYGRNQAWFEFTSQLGELLSLDFVGLPVYSWGVAAGHALRMASRIIGRTDVLICGPIGSERRAVIETMCQPPGTNRRVRLVDVEFDRSTGHVDWGDLRLKIRGQIAAVYFETPSFLGIIEPDPSAIVKLAHAYGAAAVVGVDPITLGVLAPPGDYGADIAVGSIQPLGVHMFCGGGLGGFIASQDRDEYAREYPTLNISLTDTIAEGERGFGMALFGQTSYGSRENGNDWTGNSTYLWAIAASTYMALLGPQGFVDLGRLILQRSHYASHLLEEIDGIDVVHPEGFFKEFVVSFGRTGRTVSDINRGLRQRGIFGGYDLSSELPALGQCSLYSVTEVHSRGDLDRLASSLREVLRG